MSLPAFSAPLPAAGGAFGEKTHLAEARFRSRQMLRVADEYAAGAGYQKLGATISSSSRQF